MRLLSCVLFWLRNENALKQEVGLTAGRRPHRNRAPTLFELTPFGETKSLTACPPFQLSHGEGKLDEEELKERNKSIKMVITKQLLKNKTTTKAKP